MDPRSVIGDLALFYIVGMTFYGMLFAFREVQQNSKIKPEHRLPIILGLIVVNLFLGPILFLLIGTVGAAWVMTEKQKRNKQ